jgi:hypothetical protein
MAIDINSFMNEMAKFQPEQFEKGELLLRKGERNFEVVEKSSLSKKVIKSSPNYKINTFAHVIAQAFLKAQNVDQKKLEESKGKYFALLKHVYVQKNTPKGLQKIFSSLEICDVEDPQKKAEDEIEKLIGQDSFKDIKMSYFQGKIKQRQEQLKNSIEKGIATPASHFEKSFFDLMQKKIGEERQNANSLLGQHDCCENLTKFARSLPPLLANKAFAENLWKVFLVAQQQNAKLTLHDFLKNKQNILEEESFKKLATRLNDEDHNPLEQAYLTSQLTQRLGGTLSKEQLQAAEKTLDETFKIYQDLMQDLENKIPRALVDAKKVERDLNNTIKSPSREAYQKNFAEIEGVISGLQDIQYFLWPDKYPSKIALHAHLQPGTDYKTLTATLTGAQKKLDQIKKEIREESFLQLIGEKIEKEQLDDLTSHLPKKCLDAFTKFTNALPPMPTYAYSPLAKGLYNDFTQAKTDIYKFLQEKQQITEEKSFKNLAARLQAGKLTPLQREYIVSQLTSRLERKISKEDLLIVESSSQDTLNRLYVTTNSLNKTLKPQISETINRARDALSKNIEPMFYPSYEKDFKEAERIIAQLEDMQCFLWPEEHPSRSATEAFPNPQESYEKLKKELDEKIQSLEASKNQASMSHLEESFLRIIEENGSEMQPDDFTTPLKKQFDLNSLITFARALPPLLANETMAKTLWSAFQASNNSLNDFFTEKQKILEEPSFKAMAAQLREEPLNRLKQGYLKLATERLEGKITEEGLKKAKDDEMKIPEGLKNNISNAIKNAKRDFATFKEPIFYKAKKQDIIKIENLISQLEDIQYFLWPEEHPSKAATQAYPEPGKDYERITKELEDASKILGQNQLDFEKNKEANVKKNTKIFRSALSGLEKESRELLEKEIKGKDLTPILLHPGFTAICDALKLPQDNPIDATIQEMAISWISAFCKSKKPNVSKHIPENPEQVFDDFRKNLTIFKTEYKNFLSVISQMSPGPKEQLEKAIYGKDITPILSHPEFTELCDALQLSREKLLDKATQDRVVYWISRYLQAKDKDEELFKYIPKDAGAILEKQRESLTAYEATIEAAKKQLESNIKELDELLSHDIDDKSLKKNTEKFLKTLKENLEKLSQPIDYTIHEQPFVLPTGMEKKMQEIRKAFLQL